MRLFTFLPGILQHRWLYAVSLAVVLPTAVLLLMQYRALRMLEQTLPVYRRELMSRFLDTISSEVFHTYRNYANRVLSVPAGAITLRNGGVVQASGDDLLSAVSAVSEHFSLQEFKGARRFFLVLATEVNGRGSDEVLFYNPKSRSMEFDNSAAELRAIRVACAAYLIYLRAGASNLQRGPIGIDRDPNYTMMVKFILDGDGRMVGIAGFMLDWEWLKKETVTQAIHKQLPLFFRDEADQAVVMLRVDDEQVLYESQPANGLNPEVSMRLAPYFVRFGLGIAMRGLSATQWARRSLILNAILSVAMMLVLTLAFLWGWRVAARELKLSQMKTDFVANISHEFRTPLASILALAELMRLGRVKDAEEVREFGYYIESQGHRVMQLVNNILDFARLEAGQKEFQFAPVDVRDVVNNALEACAGRLKQSGHSIEVTSPPTLPLLQLDAPALTLALTNLLDNALKYSNGGLSIEVRLQQQDDEILLSVTDQGIGIARDEQARIFEKFYRVGTGMVHDVKGSGLGLALVRHIVEAHRGYVTVESTLGSGSTFTIHLPVPGVENAKEVQCDAQNPADRR